MSVIERKTFSLPPELMQALDEEAMTSRRSVNAIVVERLCGALEAQRLAQQLQADNGQLSDEVAKLEADLATRPPPDFQDLILQQTPGTAKLIRERDEAQAECDRLTSELAQMRQSQQDWEQWGRRRDAACKALKKEVEQLSAQRDGLRATIRERDKTIEAHVPEIRKIREAHRGQMRVQALIGVTHGLVIAIPLMALLLFLTPHETSAMRFVATAAMGETGDRQRAAARLHGMPLGGAGSQLQLYALVHTGKNGERLNRCFEKAWGLKPKGKRQSIPCTIDVPREVELATTLLRKGPFDIPRDIRTELKRNENATITAIPSPKKAG
jgi:FtsZ-binding cell division protein ZapB